MRLLRQNGFYIQYHVKLAYKEGHKENMTDWKIDNGFW